MATLLLLGVAAIGLYYVWVCVSILSIAWSPKLSKIPNAHWSSPYSRWWQLHKTWKGLDHVARREAHKKHGPVVRISPTELSVNCIEGVQTIYGGNWDKTDVYEFFTNYDQPPSVSLLKAKPHASRKRTLAQVYSKTYITNSPALSSIIHSISTSRLAPLLRSHATTTSNTPLNILPLAESYAMDVSSAYIYGPSSGTNWTENPAEAQPYLDAFRASFSSDAFWLVEMPVVTTLLAAVGFNLVDPQILRAYEVRAEFGRMMGERAHGLVAVADRRDGGGGAAAVVYGYMHAKLQSSSAPGSTEDTSNTTTSTSTKPPSSLPPPDTIKDILASEMLDHIHAGHEGPGLLTTYFLYEIARSPQNNNNNHHNHDYQTQLRTELRALRLAGKDPASTSPLLEDMLLETMRLHPPVWGPFPRVSPAGGGRVAGFEVPGGVTVGASPYLLGLDEGVFERAGEWVPERWKGYEEEGRRREVERWVWGFGSGSRGCVGRHLADVVMKSMLVTILEEFAVTIAEESDMTHVEGLLAWPKDMKLMLHFSQV